jgi:hypothetical protein
MSESSGYTYTAQSTDDRSSTQARLENNWNRLEYLTRSLLVNKLHDVEQHASYVRMLNDLRQDRTVYGETLLGLYRAPASKNRHHDCEGGLVAHLVQMWDLWTGLRSVIKGQVGVWMHAQLSDQNMWLAILHHDLNKIWKYKLVSGSPWQVDYANTDRTSALLGDTSKSMWLLQHYDIKLSIPLYNALIVAEGGFSKVRPHAESVLAKVAYLIDELSANVVDRMLTDRFWDSKRGGLREEA